MAKILLLIGSLIITEHALYAQKKNLTPAQISYSINQKFSADTIRHSIDATTKELSLKHPGFYRYNSKEEFTTYIDSIKSTITDSLTLIQAFLKIKPIISKIHCLHTDLSLPQYCKDSLNQAPNLFPFQISFADNKTYIINNHSDDSSITNGQEIVSINGQPIDAIVQQLLPLIPSDGYNLTMKYRALYYQFPTWYRYMSCTETFELVTKVDGIKKTYNVKGKKYHDLAKDGFLKEPVLPKQLEFKIDNNTGFLSIHSFAKSDIKRAKQDFKPFIDKVFADLKNNRVQHLVVDLRDNTGGSDPYAAYFTSYFFNQPFRYWDRIEITEPIAKEIKGVMLKTFYRKPIKKDSSWLWQKSRHVRDFDFYEEQQPAKNNYTGNTYVLINGFCMSSCADVAAVLSSNKKAIFIGEETGGGYEGNNSGMMPEIKLEPFNFNLTVPLQKYVNAVHPPFNKGRGTMPDYTPQAKPLEISKGIDSDMNMVLALIANDSKLSSK